MRLYKGEDKEKLFIRLIESITPGKLSLVICNKDSNTCPGGFIAHLEDGKMELQSSIDRDIAKAAGIELDSRGVIEYSVD